MADDPERSEKTEDPSAKKIADALKRGDVAKSQEVTTWFMLLGTALVFGLMAPSSTGAMVTELRLMMANADMIDTAGAGFGEFWRSLAQNAIMITVLPMLTLAACAILANLVQHRLVFSGEQLKPKLEKISPLAGFRRLFSLDALVNFAKGLLKLSIVGTVMFFVLWPERDRLDTMVTADVGALLGMFQEMGLKLIGATLVVVTVIALADFLYQRHRWWQRQKMTVREVREEFKQMEGDPTIKARIRQVRNERGRRRMMLAVPEADVVIANPTHFAVALKYDKSMPAPAASPRAPTRSPSKSVRLQRLTGFRWWKTRRSPGPCMPASNSTKPLPPNTSALWPRSSAMSCSFGQKRPGVPHRRGDLAI